MTTPDPQDLPVGDTAADAPAFDSERQALLDERDAAVDLDERRGRGAAAERLQPERAGPGEEVEDAHADGGRGLGEALPPDFEGLRRGDLVFWRGHVGLMLDSETLIHANGHHMAVAGSMPVGGSSWTAHTIGR